MAPTDLASDQYECVMLGCDFVGTRAECLAHEAEQADHDQFWSLPSWPEPAKERPIWPIIVAANVVGWALLAALLWWSA